MKQLRAFAPLLMVIILVLWHTATALAQCPMCKASVESSLASGSHVALGINNGIMYLLAAPFLMFSALFFLWYVNNKKGRQQMAK